MPNINSTYVAKPKECPANVPTNVSSHSNYPFVSEALATTTPTSHKSTYTNETFKILMGFSYTREKSTLLDKWIYSLLKFSATGNTKKLEAYLPALKLAHRDNQHPLLLAAYHLAKLNDQTECCHLLHTHNPDLIFILPSNLPKFDLSKDPEDSPLCTALKKSSKRSYLKNLSKIINNKVFWGSFTLATTVFIAKYFQNQNIDITQKYENCARRNNTYLKQHEQLKYDQHHCWQLGGDVTVTPSEKFRCTGIFSANNLYPKSSQDAPINQPSDLYHDYNWESIATQKKNCLSKDPSNLFDLTLSTSNSNEYRSNILCRSTKPQQF